jgi:hypothetical protein
MPVTMAVSELDQNDAEMKAKFKCIKSQFRIAVCQLRSPNEIRTECGIHAMISRHVKRDSLRNIIQQLFGDRNDSEKVISTPTSYRCLRFY